MARNPRDYDDDYDDYDGPEDGYDDGYDGYDDDRGNEKAATVGSIGISIICTPS